MAIKARVLTRFPARVIGGTGISVTASNGTYTIALNTTIPTDGVWSNMRLAKTAAYIAANADKGKTIALGGTAFYSLTFSAASGFDSNFAVLVVNEDTTRGKNIVLTGGTNFILWPGQSCFVLNDNNVWKVTGKPDRWVLPSAFQFYVNPISGLNTNDGLATGSGAFLTIQHAAEVVAKYLDLSLFNVVIQLADGTYAENISLPGIYLGYGPLGQAMVAITGNNTTPANVLIQPASGVAILGVGAGPCWTFRDLKVAAPGSTAIEADINSFISLDNVHFGAATIHCEALYGGKIEFINHGYTIAAGAFVHLYALFGGQILYQGCTVTLSGTPAFTVFASVESQGQINATAVTYSGGATGTRFSQSGGGEIIVTGGDPNSVLPGNVNGAYTPEPVNRGGTGTVDAFTAWTAFVPVVTPGAGSLTAYTAQGRQKTIGKMVFFEMTISITTNGTAAAYLSATLPANASSSFAFTGKETGVSNKALVGTVGPAVNALIFQFYDGTYPGANGATLILSGNYETT